MRRKKGEILVTSLGGIELKLPIIQLGQGLPKLLIINNLHGDELGGFYVLEKFLADLSKVKGTLTIVTTANPLGLLNKHRLQSVDFVDLNRGFPVQNKDRGIGVAVKKELINLGMQHDVILDLHGFARPCFSAGLKFEQSSKQNGKLVDKFLKVLNTDIIYKMNIKGKEEKRAASAFDIFMTEKKKVCVAVEYPPSHLLSDLQIQKYAQGIRNVLSIVGLCKKSVKSIDLDVFERQQIINQDSGLFIPKRKLGDEVATDDVIGHMINVKTLKRKVIRSRYSGILTEIAERRFYLFGEKLATVGRKIKG